jgi:hypothetical protein
LGLRKRTRRSRRRQVCIKRARGLVQKRSRGGAY